MNRKPLTCLFSVLAMMMIAATNIAQAADEKEEANELKQFSEAKISLLEAISLAEKHTGGKAMEAKLDDEATTPQFEVEVLKHDKTTEEVKVDGLSGLVLKNSAEGNSKGENEKETDKD